MRRRDVRGMWSLAIGAFVAVGVALIATSAGVLAVPMVAAEDAPSAPAPPVPPAGTIDEAEALLNAGKLADALRAFQPLSEAPDGGRDPRVQSGLGRCRLLLGDPQGALDPLSIAARRRGSNDDRLLYAKALVATAKSAQAQGGRTAGVMVASYLDDAITQAQSLKDPTLSDLVEQALLVGQASLERGDAAGARAALSASSLLDHATGQDLLARAAWALGDFRAAAEAWLRAKNRRAAALAFSRVPDEQAVTLYAELVQAAPDDLSLIDEATRAVIAVGKVAALDATLAAIPSGGAAIPRARGRLAEWSGKKDVAIARYREARALAPADVEIATDLGRALVQWKPDDAAVLDEAIALFVEVLKGSPSPDSLQFVQADLHFIAGRDVDGIAREWPDRRRLDRGVTIFRALADADPTDGTAWQNLANALRNAGDAAAAVATAKKAVECNPYDAGIENNLGIALVAAGDRDAAVDAFERAAKLDPGDTAARQNAGRVLVLRGDGERARDHYAAALGSTRAIGGQPQLFRGFLDRLWRVRVGATPR